MDSRKRFENLYKRQKLVAELQYGILKEYIKLNSNLSSSGSESKVTSKKQLMSLLHELEARVEKVKSILLNFDDINRREIDSKTVLQQVESIATGTLDKLTYEPLPMRLQELFPQTKNLQIVVEAESVDSCILVDPKIVNEVVYLLDTLFSNVGASSKCTVTQDKNESMLFFRTTHLPDIVNDIYKDVSALHANGVVDELGTNTILLFMASSLCGGSGGGMELVENKLGFSIPCDPSDACGIPPRPVNPEESPVTPAPVQQPISPTSPESQQPQKKLKRKLNILMAEDNSTLRLLFKKWWSNKGHNVFTVSNGQEAINMFRAQNFDIVFMDVEMPLMDGLAAARDIRSYEHENSKRRTPIIAVSGILTKEYEAKTKESGMDEFLSKTKGYQWPELYKVVVDYCGEPAF